MSRNKVTQNSVQQEQSEKGDHENVSGFLVSAEIQEYWKLMAQLDWPKISPETVRDSPFCKSVCTSSVVWFLMSQAYFPKNKLFSVAENIGDQVNQNFAAKNQKLFVRLMGFLLEKANSGPSERYTHLSSQFKAKVI